MRYAARKLLTLLVTMVVVSFLTFAAFDLISGDPATAMLGTQATPETVAALRAQLGLDAPLPVRYSQWLLGFFNGDLGMSFQYRLPVRELLASKIMVTLGLSLVSFALITVVSLPLGLLTGGPPLLYRHFDLVGVRHYAPHLCPRGFSGAAGKFWTLPCLPLFRGGLHRHPPGSYDGADASQHGHS